MRTTIFAAALILAIGASAQDGDASVVTRTAAAPQLENLYRASKIIGAEVRDGKERKLGRIADLIMDRDRGEVAYAVLDPRPTSGDGKLHPVPWQALQAEDGGRHYVLQADRDTLAGAPGFSARQWPDLTDDAWSEEAERYWNRMVGRGPPAGISGSSGANAASDGGAGGGRPPSTR